MRDVTRQVPKAGTIVTSDGVPIDAVHLAGDQTLGIVLAHGFTQNWQRPGVWKVATRLNRAGGVVTFDFRGHGRSGGVSTLGDKEIADVEVAVAYARELGYQRVVTVGFSMGGSIVLRHAALIGGTDAVVSVSAPGQWFYRGTKPMRRVHRAVEHRAGRLYVRTTLGTRIVGRRWDPVPMPPDDAAALISPVPLLIVHGDQDHFFPVEHAHRLYAAARDPKELWIVPGFGHAESAARFPLLDRIGRWMREPTAPADVSSGPDGPRQDTVGADSAPPRPGPG
jgi:pimeloyl-ACP methyl ester carboxylesterase